jgi:hypothetical protein
VAEVDPNDDSRTRWVLRWFRFDPERNERRHVIVAAYSRKGEFHRAFGQLSKDLERRKSAGLSEAVEHVSGVQLRPGHQESVRQMRLEKRRILQSWKRQDKEDKGP